MNLFASIMDNCRDQRSPDKKREKYIKLGIVLDNALDCINMVFVINGLDIFHVINLGINILNQSIISNKLIPMNVFLNHKLLKEIIQKLFNEQRNDMGLIHYQSIHIPS